MHKKLAVSSMLMAATSPFLLFSQNTNQHPNIVLIMCDDMGFSDLACFGGEINTPNIDLLSESGHNFTQFKNTGRSCPSRASLLTGYYQHNAGIGWMAEVDEHRPGYRGQISKTVPTIAEVFKNNGYSTYMSGKWHVSLYGSFGKPNGSYPTQRGFDKYYGCLAGGGSYITPKPLYNNLEPVTTLPDDYYYTTAITDSAVSFIHSHPKHKPMFMYIAHYAPHLPLQAPQNRIDQCMARYKVGYDILREKRFARLKSLGIIDSDFQLPTHKKEFNMNRPSWDSLSDNQKEKWINDMATYAAMIEIMDDGIGEVINTLREKQELDNTIFIFLSDNGSTSEGGFIKQLMADLSNTPYRSYKQWCYNGGTSTPMILTYGKNINSDFEKQISTIPAHIIDIFPTCLDMASIKYPSKFSDNKVALQGISLTPILKNKKIKKRDLFFEHQTSCAIISDHWKLVRNNGKTNWELFNLDIDPFEQNDVSSQYEQLAKSLEKKWNNWAMKNHVFPFEYRPWTERINYYKEKNPDQDGIE